MFKGIKKILQKKNNQNNLIVQYDMEKTIIDTLTGRHYREDGLYISDNMESDLDYKNYYVTIIYSTYSNYRNSIKCYNARKKLSKAQRILSFFIEKIIKDKKEYLWYFKETYENYLHKSPLLTLCAYCMTSEKTHLIIGYNSQSIFLTPKISKTWTYTNYQCKKLFNQTPKEFALNYEPHTFIILHGDCLSSHEKIDAILQKEKEYSIAIIKDNLKENLKIEHIFVKQKDLKKISALIILPNSTMTFISINNHTKKISLKTEQFK